MITTVLKNFLLNIKDHPKTSAAGFAAIAGTIAAAKRNPAILTDPQTWGALLLGMGLLFASDAKQ